MTDNELDFDELTRWMEATTPRTAPGDLVDRALGRVASTSQRPGWLVPERWTLVESTLRLTRAPRTVAVLVVLAALLLLLFLALTLGGVGGHLFPPKLPIAFASNRDGVNQIYLMAADGSSQGAITSGSDNENPIWSPDGSRMLVVSKRSGSPQLFVMNADGSGATQLTNVAHALGHAAWSPDGRRIAYHVDTTDSGCYEVFVMNAVGSGQTQVTGDNAGCNWAPDWSRDGARILFSTTRDGPFELATMRPDGSLTAPLASQPNANDAFARYSPDGTQIAFTTWDPNLDAASAEVVVEKADGTGRHQVTSNAFEDGYPAWSPDGKHLVFMSRRDGSWEVYTADPDGSNQVRLTTSPADDVDPSWR